MLSIEQLEQDHTCTQDIGIYSIDNANSVVKREMDKPDPRQLYLSLWYEGELCCLFADTNLGKSILAIQIGEDIAKTVKDENGNLITVIVFDYELSDKQFQLRYAGEGYRHIFPNTFKRAVINRLQLQDNTEESYLYGIDEVIKNTGARVVIVDNLTWLCNDSEKCGNAATFMKGLMMLKFKYEISMLVIAHTPKRDMTSPITPNSLAGSKRLMNFFDSAFAIGQSAQDENLRYIKQIKCRNGSFQYDSENVILCEIVKAPDGFLHFEIVGFSTEREHLKVRTDKEIDEQHEQILSLKSKGLSLHKIAEKLGISYSRVQRFNKNGSAGSMVHDEPSAPNEPPF